MEQHEAVILAPEEVLQATTIAGHVTKGTYCAPNLRYSELCLNEQREAAIGIRDRIFLRHGLWRGGRRLAKKLRERGAFEARHGITRPRAAAILMIRRNAAASWWGDVTGEWKDKLDELAGLLRESEAESAWERAVAAGTIGNPLAVMLDIYEHGGIAYSISGGGTQCRWDTTRGGAVWTPDDEAEENIRYNVLRSLGIGEVKWFGACGSKGDPLNARYSLDGGNSWVGNFAKWSQAIDAMVAASGRKIDPAELARLLSAEAEQYCKSVLEEYSAWVNGEVYGVVVYVIDRQTGERIEAEDDECWGYLGGDYAEKTLEDTILNTVMRLGATKH